MKGVLDVLQSWGDGLTAWLACHRRPNAGPLTRSCHDDHESESPTPPPPPPDANVFTIELEHTEDYRPAEPVEIEFAPDRVFIGMDDCHWSYQGPQPESYLITWLEGLYGSQTCCLRVRYNDRVVFRPCFYDIKCGNLDRFLTSLKEARPNRPPPSPAPNPTGSR